MKSVSRTSLAAQYKSVLAGFPPASRRVLRDVFQQLSELPADLRQQAESALERANRSLPSLIRARDACPISPSLQRLGSRSRNGDSLVEALCRNDFLPHDFTIPTGAQIGRSLVLARVNFLKSLRYCVESSSAEWKSKVLEQLEVLEENTLLCKLAEELLTYVVSNVRNTRELRKAAARKLLAIWNHLDDQEIGDFPGVLLSAWKARSRVKTIYGTLFGSDEVMSLMRCECEPRFLNFFTRDQVTQGETQAFREFLFGLPHEELHALEAYMTRNKLAVISRDQVQEILDREATYTPPMDSDPTANEIFASYYRRRIRAEYRALAGSDGPQKTAEGYIMEALLREEAG